jgi:hypothetical protein
MRTLPPKLETKLNECQIGQHLLKNVLNFPLFLYTLKLVQPANSGSPNSLTTTINMLCSLRRRTGRIRREAQSPTKNRGRGLCDCNWCDGSGSVGVGNSAGTVDHNAGRN